MLRDADFDVAPDGSFEVFFGGPARAANWLALPERRVRAHRALLLRGSRAGGRRPEPARPARRSIRSSRSGPPAPWDDASVAAGYRRVTAFLRNRTLEQAKPGEREQPSWVSSTPNEFPQPELPGDFAFAAFDAAYSMAPYALAPDEALVITGRWPRVPVRERRRCGTATCRPTTTRTGPPAATARTRNSRPTAASASSSPTRIPGVPNWIDTEGRGFGLVFWRFFMPEGEVETPQAHVVKLADLQ